MTDLTKITTPFGLLDKDTQDALKAAFEAGVKIEAYTSTSWEYAPYPSWVDHLAYRANPKTVRTGRSWSFITHSNGTYIKRGQHLIECNEDGTEPTVTWEPSQ